jgi:hypothetical protein
MVDTYAGTQSVFDGGTEYSRMAYVVRSILGRTATATLVIVKTVTNAGEVEPVGLIDVQPMVAQLDGKSQPTPHGIIHDVPYFRVQGGTNAVIMDPKVGDIGICVFASHDLSAVKENKAPSNPGSRRRFSMADALYIGGVLNGTPENYIRFTSDGEIELSPATKVKIIGDLEVTGDISTEDGDVIAGTVSLSDHVHSGVTTGGGDSGPPVP